MPEKQVRYCKYEGCGARLPITKKSWCYKHDTPASRRIVTRTCRFEGCDAVVSNTNGKARYCDKHRDSALIHAATQKRYYQKNREKCLAAIKDWQMRNPDYSKRPDVIAYRRQYYLDNREYYISRSRESYLKRKNQCESRKSVVDTSSPEATPA